MKFILERPNCSECPLKCNNVGPSGPIDADIVIVADTPSQTDKRADRPLAGTSGNILWPEIPEALRSKIYTTFALPCISVKSKDIPTKMKAVKHCSNRVASEISAYPRKLIITLGNGPTASVTGNYNIKITQDRGQLVPHKDASIGVMPIIGPMALVRGSGSIAQFKADIAYALALVDGQPQRKPVVPETHVVSEADLDETLKDILSYEHVAGDIETGGFNRQHDPLLCLGVAGDPKLVHVFPREMINDDDLVKHIQPMFQQVQWIWHNGKFDAAFLRVAGHRHAYVAEDTMLLSYCLDENPGSHGLKQLSKNLIGAPDYAEELKKYLPNKKTSYEAIPLDVLYPYCSDDVSNTLQIWKILAARVKQDPDLARLYRNVLIPASECLQRIEARGIFVDQKRLHDLSDPEDPRSLYSEVQVDLKKIQTIAGFNINPNSPKQMAALLFDEMKLPKKQGRSTNAKVMEMLPHVPIVSALQKYRKTSKLYSTYVKNTPDHIDPDTGLIHTTFKIHGTRTGRLASEKPNLQNIPRNPRVRGMFIPRPGYEFLEVDLNQAELRCLAQLANCKDLIAIYNDPTHEGLHHEISRFLFGKDFTSEQKMRGKAVNFGIVYGREARSLADEFEVPLVEAQRWIDGWFERFPGAGAFVKKCRKAAIAGHTLTTTFGRKKRHGLVTRETLREIQNQAANFPHQSIASDITLMASFKVQDRLEALGCYMMVLVHDSTMMEVPITHDNRIRREAAQLTVKVMESIAPMYGLNRIPFLADCKVGNRWGELNDYKP